MTTYDPRVLIRAFNTLQEEFQRFNQTSSDTLKEAEHTQKCAQDRVNQALRVSAIALSQAKSDIEDVQVVDQEVRDLLSNSSAAVETAHRTVEMVGKFRQQAETTLATWQNKLQKAIAWQAQAEARLQRAIQEYNQAQRSLASAQQNLASAQQNLASAEASLRSCMNNPESKNCNREQRAYDNANVAVAVAIQELQRAGIELQQAEIEVEAAQEELERAKAKVRDCQQAVGYAEQAVQHANLATEQANQAITEAERSLESAESANRAVTKASTKATEEHELTEQATGQVHQAEGFVTQAQVSVQRARNQADSAYNFAVRGNQELGYRTKLLVLFNQVDSSLSATKTVQSNSATTQPQSSVANSLADSLKYVDRYNYLDEENGSVRIEAKDMDGKDVGFITAERTSNNRIKIKDTVVPDDLQKKGIGSGLLSRLENRFPKGTELYFQENQKPEFWSKKGFQQRVTKDGITEFFKVIE
ncbi:MULTISPECIES: hypothetical protein [Nostocales]|uniref:Uncharacterized protein n=1 Tax=Dolichospermum flos-aquae UHCC 0037 TaxID=2590026 RepID=A0ACC7SB44_DOLFA|nr:MULTISPECIES: hypothetical protein [Nostocales]MBO1063214.1 hypothetical protein [Anabaena sp. 54]MTJ45541.1 hypothetical protein [Dolichospermum flos-aquae UHCC 0037]